MTKMKMTKKELEKILSFSLKTAMASGEMLLRYRKKIATIKVSYKIAQGVVSEADFASEKFIISEIGKNFPGHEVLGEEMSYALMKNKNDYRSFENETFC